MLCWVTRLRWHVCMFAVRRGSTHPCWVLHEVGRLPKVCTPYSQTLTSFALAVILHGTTIQAAPGRCCKPAHIAQSIAALTHAEEGRQDNEDKGQLNGGAVEVAQVRKHGPGASITSSVSVSVSCRGCLSVMAFPLPLPGRLALPMSKLNMQLPARTSKGQGSVGGCRQVHVNDLNHQHDDNSIRQLGSTHSVPVEHSSTPDSTRHPVCPLRRKKLNQ